MSEVTVLEKEIKVNPLTFQPIMHLTLKLELTLEKMQDEMAMKGKPCLHETIGQAIIDAVHKFDK